MTRWYRPQGSRIALAVTVKRVDLVDADPLEPTEDHKSTINQKLRRRCPSAGCTFTAWTSTTKPGMPAGSFELVRHCVPATVSFEGQITDNDWRLVAPGLVGGALSIVESIFRLPPPRYAPSAEILSRSLIDYVITFAWLAVPEKRQERLNAFEESFYNESEGLDAKYTTEFQGKNQPKPKRSKRSRDPSDRQKVIAHYTKLIKAGQMPPALLTDRMRVLITERRKIAKS